MKYIGILIIILLVSSSIWWYGRTKENSSSATITTATSNQYLDPQYKFSFSKPEGFVITSFKDEGGYTVLLQDKDKNGIQIYISPFDEDIVLTGERIKKDIPDIVMNNIQTISVGGVQAQAFEGQNSIFGGATHEVWFVHQYALYQIVTKPALESTLQTIITSWKFN